MRHTLVAILALTAAATGTAAAQQHGRAPRPYTTPPGIILSLHAFAMPGLSVHLLAGLSGLLLATAARACKSPKIIGGPVQMGHSSAAATGPTACCVRSVRDS